MLLSPPLLISVWIENFGWGHHSTCDRIESDCFAEPVMTQTCISAEPVMTQMCICAEPVMIGVHLCWVSDDRRASVLSQWWHRRASLLSQWWHGCASVLIQWWQTCICAEPVQEISVPYAREVSPQFRVIGSYLSHAYSFVFVYSRLIRRLKSE
jgi:hypothetical protein